MKKVFTGKRLQDEGVKKLCNSGTLAECIELNLWDNKISDIGAQAIANCRDLSKLQILRLGWNKIGPDGAKTLAKSPYLKNLKTLQLYHNDILDEGACSLVQSNSFELQNLNMCCNQLGPKTALAMASSASLTKLRKLHIGANQLGNKGLKELLKLPVLEELNMRLNNIESVGLKSLEYRKETLAHLALDDNPFGDQGVEVLAQSGALTTSESINLINTNISAKGAKTIARCPRKKPGDLRLGSNNLKDRGVEALLCGPYLGSIEKLNLQWNDIGLKGAELLANSSKLSRLKILDLVGNQLEPKAINALQNSPFLNPQAIHFLPKELY